MVVDFPTSRPTFVPPPDEPPAPTAESVIERSAMVKGYEYEKGKFVLFTPEELKALEAASRQTVDIISFIPHNAIDPIYYDKAYFLAPDKRGSKPYNLLLRAMRDTRRCALAKWAFRSKEYVVQIRAADGGMILQQLLYAEEVRSFAGLRIELTDVGDAELKLAKQLIEHLSAESYDPTEFVDEEKRRIFAAVAEKIAGKQVVAPEHAQTTGGQVVDLLEALRASLQPKQGGGFGPPTASKSTSGERKPAKRAPNKPAEAARASNKVRSSKR
jgi:DNA end-binding protein Ku